MVEFLAAHPFVARVGHPMLESHPSHALAQKLLPKGAGSVFSFDMKGNREQGKKFIEALKVFSHLANVGDCRSLVIHPASTTHFRMTDEALARRRHRAGHDPPVDRPGRSGRPDRRPEARAEGGREGEGLSMELTVNGHRTFCYTGGKPFDAAKPTVVFIHGVLNDHSVWILQTRYFAHHGWNVLAPDLPGHCSSAGEPPASVEEAADFVLALLDAARREAGGAGRPQLRLADRAGGRRARAGARQPPGAGRHGLRR